MRLRSEDKKTPSLPVLPVPLLAALLGPDEKPRAPSAPGHAMSRELTQAPQRVDLENDCLQARKERLALSLIATLLPKGFPKAFPIELTRPQAFRDSRSRSMDNWIDSRFCFARVNPCSTDSW